MRNGADFLWFVFSTGGLLSALIVTGLWALRARRSRVARLAPIAVVVFYTIAGLYPLSQGLGDWIGAPYAHEMKAGDVPAGRTAVVLLGSGSYTLLDWSGQALSIPDPIGTERALEAARVFKLLKAAFLVSSGGRIYDEDPDQPAAVSMQTILTWLGVPADRIVLEQDSRNTHDEALALKKLLPSLDVDHVVLVTSPIHMRRSLGVFRAVGIDAFPAATRELRYDGDFTTRLLPSNDGLRESGLVAHEIAGYVYYRLRGWLQ